MVAPASYQVLGPGLYEIPRAEVLLRRKGDQDWFQLGDVDAFTLNNSPTKVSRFRKNAATRTKAVEVVNQIDSAVSFTVYQMTDFIRAVSVLGDKSIYTQNAVTSGTYDITAVKVGGIYNVGSLDITVDTVESGTTAFVLGTHYKIVDAALGSVQIIALPSGVSAGAAVTITYDAPAITSTDNRFAAQIASNASITAEIMVRDVGRDSIKKVLHLYEVTLAPANDIAFIGADDFSSVQITGSAVDTSIGDGTITYLAA